MWWILKWQERATLGNSPGTILEEVRRIQGTDVLPLVDASRRELCRYVPRPDNAQVMPIDRLRLQLPERLRIHSHADKM